MKITYVVAPLVILTAMSSALAAEKLTEAQARAKAVQILLGNPYGRSPIEVSRHIKTGILIAAGSSTFCGDVRNPIWAFNVVVPKDEKPNGNEINGYLCLDASSGKMIAASLPFLD